MLTHEQVQAAISARLDGESHGLDENVVDAHIAECAECRAFQDEAARLSRSLSFAEPAGEGMAPPQDLSELILGGVESEWQRTAGRRHAGLAMARILLVVIGIICAAWAVAMVAQSSGMVPGTGEVLDPTADPDGASALIEGAALRLGLASGLIFAAWRPRLAPGLMPLTCTLFAFLCGFAMRDIALGNLVLNQVYALLATGLATAALGWAWAADRGFSLRGAWRVLGADPN
ncbi:zf-HC2 domain-containing protein [Corynebacterium confusum]|uniref:zf-HC2 domain-containing protein n=1 Tax=Corynebacterium confusum TaxID=71254 RepID=UPI0025B40162|nr:zf-HC2 domain-containing protein [Corynebacterium confusum]WJY89333.1 hypothetical protein CCONF_03910 [Corynebacterium confusum]